MMTPEMMTIIRAVLLLIVSPLVSIYVFHGSKKRSFVRELKQRGYSDGEIEEAMEKYL